jgi:hypothetical protein
VDTAHRVEHVEDDDLEEARRARQQRFEQLGGHRVVQLREGAFEAVVGARDARCGHSAGGNVLQRGRVLRPVVHVRQLLHALRKKRCWVRRDELATRLGKLPEAAPRRRRQAGPLQPVVCPARAVLVNGLPAAR